MKEPLTYTNLRTIQAYLRDQEHGLNSNIGLLSIVSMTHNVTVTLTKRNSDSSAQ